MAGATATEGDLLEPGLSELRVEVPEAVMSAHQWPGEERECRVCGCTDRQACSTPSGPCHWVAWDLCSACAQYEAAVMDNLPPGYVERPSGLVVPEGYIPGR